MNSFIWYPLILLYLAAIMAVFLYTQAGFIWSDTQARAHAEAVRVDAREDTIERYNEIQELRRALHALELKVQGLESARP